MRTHPEKAGQEGVALISAIWLTIVVLGVVSTGVIILQSHRAQTRTAFAKHSQALQIARSGLVEARSWLRRQTTQPVVDFEPVLDHTASPPILDTEEPEVGIVREFRITGQTWARYEVWKEWDADPDPARLVLRRQLECEDISFLRGGRSEGSWWKLRCMGYIYNRKDASARFDQQPNYVIAKELLEVECNRIVLQLPGQGALNVGDGNNAHINTMGRIRGGVNGAGIYFPSGSGVPTVGPVKDKRVTGTPALAGAAEYDDSYLAVFGLTLDEIKALASMVVNDAALIPDPIPEGSIIVCEQTSMRFDDTRPLTGNGLVILVGNVTILPGSNSLFTGFLYVDGAFTMRQPSEIRGAVVVTENMTLQGATDYATIYYDEDVLKALLTNIGSYNIASTFKRVLAEDQ